MSESEEPQAASQNPVDQHDPDDPIAGGFFDIASFDKFINAQREKEEQKYARIATAADYPELLVEGLALYEDTQDFKKGDLVQWKPMMRNKRIPLEAAPAIVVDRIDPPLTTDPDGDRLIEPHDLLIAVVDGDKEFILAEVAARRFTEWKR